MSVFDEIEKQKKELESFKKKKKRNKEQKRVDYDKISNLYLEGVSQANIAKIVGLSQSQVANDLEAVRKIWIAETIIDIDAIKAEQLKKIDWLEKEYREAWEKSKRTRQVKTKRGGLANNTPTGRGQFEIIEEEDLGDTRYAQRIEWCIMERLKITGGYAPKKIAETDPTGTREAGTAAREEIMSWLDQQFAKSVTANPQKQLQPANLAETMENKDYIDAEEVTEPEEEKTKVTYKLLGETKGFLCLLCEKISWLPQDFANRYCKNCNLFHEDLDQQEQDEEDAKQVNPEDLNLNNPANSVMEENPEISIGGDAQLEIRHNPKHDINMSRKIDEASRMTNFGFKDGILRRNK